MREKQWRSGPSEGGADARRLIRSTYLHLAAGIVVLVGFEVLLFRSGLADRIDGAVRDVPWILILGAFVVVSWIASRMAWRLKTKALNYAGLGLYIVAKGLILVPLLIRAEARVPGVIGEAAVITLIGTLGLTAVAFTSRWDFSPLRPFLAWGGVVAVVAIVVALVSGMRLGPWFALGMIALAGGSILHDTQALVRRGRGRNPVGAALALLASVGLMFWYVLRLLARSSRR